MKPSLGQRAAALTLGVMCGIGLGDLAGCGTEAAKAAPAKSARHTIHHPPANPTRADLIRMGVPVERWASLGRCEQPGSGWRGVAWTHTGPSYLAGLGFARSTYAHYKPAAYPWPPKATPWQIMVVAERVKADVGITAWGAWRCF